MVELRRERVPWVERILEGTFVWAGNDREQRQNHVDCPGLDWFLVHTERRIRLAH